MKKFKLIKNKSHFQCGWGTETVCYFDKYSIEKCSTSVEDLIGLDCNNGNEFIIVMDPNAEKELFKLIEDYSDAYCYHSERATTATGDQAEKNLKEAKNKILDFIKHSI